MTGFGEAFAKFDAELDAAVSRARRVSAEARADSAKFRAENANLAKSVRERSMVARPDELTTQQLREQAERFRTERGLPVEPLPSAEELAEAGMVRAPQWAPPVPDEEEDFSQEKILSASNQAPQEAPQPQEYPREQAPPPPNPPRVRRRPVPRTSDDDEDFSQERILSDGSS